MKGSRLHLDLFKVFHDLAESKSFSKTAVRNYLTQSAVSQQVAFLERRLEKRLIERGKGKFSLTQEGEVFLEGCKKILEAYQEAVDKIQKKTGELSGAVKVETVYSIGLHQLSLYIKAFMRRYDKVNLHVEYNRSDRIYLDVLQGFCDLGIVAYPRRHPLIRLVPFKKEKLVLVSSPEDPLAKSKRASLKGLDRQDFIAFDKAIPTRRAIDEILKKHKVLVNIVHEFDNIETLKRSVEVGAGVSILPENTVVQEVKNRTLVRMALSEGPFYRPTGIILRQGKVLSRATQEFIHWLRA